MTHYETLGIPTDASAMEVVNAYRKAAQIHHPDRGGDGAMMKAVNGAYEVLRHPARRAANDAELLMQAQAEKEKGAPVATAQRKARKRASQARTLITFYAVMVPVVLAILYDVCMITLDVVGTAAGPNVWLLVPGLILAVVITRNIRGAVLRFVVG